MQKLVEKYCEMPTSIRRPMWRIWHNLILKLDKNKEAVFMNYGYHTLNGDPLLELKDHDENNRYCIQLYDFVVNKVDVKGKDVLEVGSGRGGGASYITRYFGPKSYTAMDISSSVIDFCNKYHNVEGLKFITGVAEEPPFADSSFDVVVNVESARCYKSIKTFFAEVHRMLRPGGHFCFADMIKKGEYQEMRNDLISSGMEIISETNISQNVVKALDLDNERREAIISKKVPKFLKKAFFQFAGTKGTERYESFANGKMEYWHFVLRKN
ncbi:MAG: class I SAM-dependent methyltransferase [Bacteroidetes bacterium HGW-Bacteroidetes-15]|nr:MAG: class I SAM-dependent methyltransferase [Bacteroidetes bacterium HGW-Bacteroidetes-15]